jgi:glycerophosphoryl diester phosphodiesterase
MARILKLLSVASVMSLLSFNSLAYEIVAHRGASHDAPENTLAAMKLGYERGAEAGELDIHLTKDGRIAVLHDLDTKRVAGVTNKVAAQTFAELRALEAGQWGDWKGKGFSEKIPSLDEVWRLVPDGRKLFIEIKCGVEILPALAESMAKSAKKPEQLVIITFHHDVAKAAKLKFPRQQVYWLVGWSKDKITGEYPNLDDVIARAKAAGVDGLDLNFNFPLDAANVKKIKAAGLQCHVWTVDDADKAEALVKAGVDSLTTNRPKWLREQLRARGQ